MAEPARPKVAITKAALDDARARKERAWNEAVVAAAHAAPAVRSDVDRTLRTLALGAGACCAFLPLARNAAVVALLTLGPAVSSALAERAPEAEDMPRARFVSRTSPLVVPFVLILTALFPYVSRLGAIEAALAAQSVLALFLYVPRVRALHLLVTGWAALASVALEDRALLGAAPFFALALVAAALDRSLHVRTARVARAEPELRVPLASGAAVAAVFLLALAGALAACPPLERWLPAAPATVRMVRPPTPQEARKPILELVLAVLAVFVFFAVFRWLADRYRKERSGALLAAPIPQGRTAVVPLDELAGVERAPWPSGPRRALVRRYLEHLGALARLGVARRASEAALDVSALVGRRDAGAAAAEEELARAFHAARYSPAPVAPELLEAAERAARAVEERLRPPG